MAGMEAMLRAMGMGEVLDAANEIAKSGAVPKIIDFANNVGPLRDQLGRIELKLDAFAASTGASAPDGGPWGAFNWSAGLGEPGREPGAGTVASGRGDPGQRVDGPVIEGSFTRKAGA